MSDQLVAQLFGPTLGPVVAGTAALGAVAGAIGTFAVVRRRSLQGDAVSHAALPGVALAYLLGGRSEVALVLGAAVTGWVAMACVAGVVGRSRVPFDAALGGALAVFFGLGLMLLTYFQGNRDRLFPGEFPPKFQDYLFGQQAALMRRGDLYQIVALGGVAVAVVVVLWKEFKLLSFDPDFAASVGLPTRRLDLLLTGLVVLAVVLGLQTVGVVLLSSLIVAPAAAARQWSDRLGRVVLIAAVLGAVAGLLGTVGSHLLSGPRVLADGRVKSVVVPTGPTVVLAATAIALGSLALAPRRGLLWNLLRPRPTLTAPEASP